MTKNCPIYADTGYKLATFSSIVILPLALTHDRDLPIDPRVTVHRRPGISRGVLSRN